MQNWYVAIFISAAFIILSLLNITSNSLLIYGLHKSNQLKNVSNKLIMSMSISDLCIGVFVLPVQALRAMPEITLDAWILKAIYILAHFATLNSGLLLICIAVDRYIHIIKPRLYQSDLNGRRLVVLVMGCFVISSVITITHILLESFWQYVAIAILNISLMSGLTILYTKMYRKIQQHQINAQTRLQKINNGLSNNNRRVVNGDSQTGQLSAVRTIRLVLVVIFICYLPFTVIATVGKLYEFELKAQQGEIFRILYATGTLLIEGSTVINSVIIIYGNTRCKQAILSLFRSTVVPRV